MVKQNNLTGIQTATINLTKPVESNGIGNEEISYSSSTKWEVRNPIFKPM